MRTATVFWKCVDVLARCNRATQVSVFRSGALIFFSFFWDFSPILKGQMPSGS